MTTQVDEGTLELARKAATQNQKTAKAIEKSLTTQPIQGQTMNPDVLFCITTEDVVFAANEQLVPLTLEQARAIGRRAFKHFSSEDIMCMVAEVVEEFAEEQRKKD